MSQTCPVCRSMLTPAELSRGQCASCDAKFASSDTQAARNAEVAAALAAFAVPPGPPPTAQPAFGMPMPRPAPSDNPYAAPDTNFVPAVVVTAGSSEYEKAKKQAVQILFGLAVLGGGLAVLLLGVGFFGDFAEQADLKVQLLATGVEAGVFGVVFALLGCWALAQPFAAAIVGLGLYVLLAVVSIALDPASAGRGIIFRIIIIGFLAKTIYALSQGPGHAQA